MCVVSLPNKSRGYFRDGGHPSYKLLWITVKGDRISVCLCVQVGWGLALSIISASMCGLNHLKSGESDGIGGGTSECGRMNWLNRCLSLFPQSSEEIQARK